MAPQLYRIIEHTADTGFEVKSSTKEHLFETAAQAFFHIMWQVKTAKKNKAETIEVVGSDLEELLVNFLEEFLYLYDAKRLVCTQIQIEEMTDKKIRATAWLQKFIANRDQEILGVKAVTYHQLYIGEENNTWSARVFLDI